MSGVVLQIRNGLPASLAPDYRIKTVKIAPGTTPGWTNVSVVEWTITVPTGKVWIPLSAITRVIASTKVGTRRCRLQIDDATGNKVMEIQSYINQTVGLDITYQWGLGLENMAVSIGSAPGWATITMPDIVCEEGWKITFDEMNDVDLVSDSMPEPLMLVLEHDATP